MSTTRQDVVAPFLTLVDSREQHPFSFTGLHADADQSGLPLVVPVEWRTLPTGDYSIDGYTVAVAIERKSREDLYHTIISERERFIRELERLNAMRFAAVVVEESLGACIRNPPDYGRMPPGHKAKTLFRSVLAFQQRYRNVHWFFCDDRRLAEVTTFRMLERFWSDQRGTGTISPAINPTENRNNAHVADTSGGGTRDDHNHGRDVGGCGGIATDGAGVGFDAGGERCPF